MTIDQAIEDAEKEFSEKFKNFDSLIAKEHDPDLPDFIYTIYDQCYGMVGIYRYI